MKKHSNASEITAYTMVALLSAAISFVTMIILTRLVSEDFFGKINKFIMASNVVMSFVCLGLDSAYIRFFYEPPENTNNKQLAWKCMIPAFMALSFVSLIIVLLRDTSFMSLLIGCNGDFFTVAFIATSFSLLLNRFMTIYFRMNSSILRFSIISVALVCFTRTIFIPIYSFSTKFEYNVVLASLFLTFFMFVFFLLNRKDIIEIPRTSSAKYNQVYRFALFSSPVFIITYLNTYLPQVIISKNLGDFVLGVYSAAMLFCLAIQVLCSGFTTFWSPYMFRNYKEKNDIIKRVHDVVLLGSILILSFALIFNDFIYLFVGENFRKNQEILGMLLIFPLVSIMVETTAYGISIKKKNEISLFIYLISTAVNIVLCCVLIFKYELKGVAIASMISAVVQMILMTYFGQKYYCSISSVVRTSFHMVMLILSAILFYHFYDNRLVFVMAEIAILILCLIYDRNVVLWVFKTLKSLLQNDAK